MMGGVWNSSHDMKTQRQREEGKERGRGRNRQEASIPFSPASAPMISLARTQRCSWARRGTSWCLPFYLGAPTHSCEERRELGKGGV